VTFSFTAMGILIAYLWVSVVFSFILAISKAVEKSPGWTLFYLCGGIALLFLLVVR
jgi:hypothetical protein